MSTEYVSSEEFQRHKADVFAREQSEKTVDVSERERIVKIIDSHIGIYESTTSVRDMAKENNRAADYQLDLSADIVKVLSKIKKELK